MSFTGSIVSTSAPALTGALGGFAVGGLTTGGPGAIPGAIIGFGAGLYYGDELNELGISAGKYFESGELSNDILNTKDSNGIRLGDSLNRIFIPREYEEFYE